MLQESESEEQPLPEGDNTSNDKRLPLIRKKIKKDDNYVRLKEKNE